MSTTLLRPLRPLALRPLRPLRQLRAYTKDPQHAHLYYHPAGANVLVSFLPAAPLPSSATYIGSLPARQGSLASFVPNARFVPLLHSAIRESIELGKAESVLYEAATRPGDGFMHIHDERNLPPPGRIGDPDDIIASIFVQDGKAVPSTYEPSPSYRLVTGEGVLTLPRGIDEYVVGVLERVDLEEKDKAKSE